MHILILKFKYIWCTIDKLVLVSKEIPTFKYSHKSSSNYLKLVYNIFYKFLTKISIYQMVILYSILHTKYHLYLEKSRRDKIYFTYFYKYSTSIRIYTCQSNS